MPLLGAGTTGGASWTPASLGSALIAWYEADVGVYSDAGVTPAINNDLIQQWNDQSGHNYHLLQPTSGSRPVFSALGMNSKYPAIRLGNGATQGMITAAGVVTGAGSAGSMFFMGNVLTTSTANARLMVYSNVGNDSVAGAGYLGRNSQAVFTSKGAGTVSSFGSSQAITYGVNSRIGTTFDGIGANSTWVNGVAGTNVTGADAWSSGGYFSFGLNVSGTGTQSTNKWDGTVSEMIFTNTNLSGSDLASLDAYLVSRWS